MSDTVNNGHQFPWEYFLLLVAYVCLELFCLLRKGKLYSAMLLEHIKYIIVSLSDELMSKGGGKKLCGIVLSMIIVSFLITIGYSLHSVFTHDEAIKPLAFTIVMSIFAFPIILVSHWINKQYISWVDKKR